MAILMRNISLLYNTAKAELARRDRQLNEIRNTLVNPPFYQMNPFSLTRPSSAVMLL
jgi:hypothetical protein